MLWFKDSDFDMPSRHGRGVAPLYKDGRLFVAGKDGIRAVDAYNGHLLWEYYIPDLQVAFDQEHLLGTVKTDDVVLVALYPRTGKVLYQKKDNIWG